VTTAMSVVGRSLVCVMVAGAVSATQQRGRGPGRRGVATIATFDSPGNTENICERADGTLFVTAMDDRVVWKITPAGTAERLAYVPGVVAVIGIAVADDGVIVGASERTWRRPGQTPAADFSDTGAQILVLNGIGKIAVTVPGQKGDFFNGIAPIGNGLYLIADTNAEHANIWQFNLPKKQLTAWLKDDQLAGANGIKVHNGWVYVSTRAGLQRVRMEKGRPVGPIMMFAKDAHPDDFDIAKDGTVYFPTSNAIIRVSAAGEMNTYLDNIQGGPAALVSRNGKWFYWPTRGGTGPEKLLRIPLQ
jgi:hypothetical protein